MSINIRKLIVLTGAILLMAAGTGCQQIQNIITTPTPQPQVLIVGVWQRTTPRGLNAFSTLMPDQIEFLKDGTWLVPGSGILNGKYMVLDAKRLKLEGLNVVFIPNFTVSATSLILQDGDTVVSYSKSQ